MKRRIQCAGLRFYDMNPENISIIMDAVERLLPFVEHIFVTVRTERDRTNAMTVVPTIAPGRVHTFQVLPWFDRQFSHILNGMISFVGRVHGCEEMLIVSPESVVTERVLCALCDEFGPDTLAVGPVLPGHRFKEGIHEAIGSMVPWNQYSLVNIRMIGDASGYAIGGDSLWAPERAGVEEVMTYASVQMFMGDSSNAQVKLLLTNEPVEVIEHHLGSNPTRKMWNATDSKIGKFGTKDSRPSQQMAQVSNLKPATVEHIVQQ